MSSIKTYKIKCRTDTFIFWLLGGPENLVNARPSLESQSRKKGKKRQNYAKKNFKKYKLDNLEAMEKFKERWYGPYCTISGNEPSSD